MKKLLITILTALSATTILAQDNMSVPVSSDTARRVAPLEADIRAEHMLFKGEQINGTLEYFSQKLERKGFSFLIPEPSGATFYGKFAGYQDCYVLVETNNNIVYRVSVAFPRRHVWDDVSADFEYLKEMLIKKYGTPVDSLIDFRTHEPRDNYSKLMKVKNNLCDYYIKFEMPRGTITLSIGSMEPSPVRRYNPCVVLAYEDKLNAQKEVTKAYDDL